MKAALFIALLVLTACDSGTGQVELTGSTMGTQFSVKLPTGIGDHDAVKLQKSIEAVLENVDAQMSTYRPDSEISRFNQSESPDWQPISINLCEDIANALTISEFTGGAFDITVGPLVELWGFGASGIVDQPPDDEAIASLLAMTGYENIHVDCVKPAIRKDIAGLKLDLSAIGKGYAADRVGLLLRSIGYENYLVEVGGELSIRGMNAKGEPWAIGIEAPLPDQRRPHTIVRLADTGMATSGDYRNFFEADGKMYSHTIDTRTGRPVTHMLASVTVVDDAAWRADALATALLVMGPEEGLAFAESEELAVLMLIRTNGHIEERQTAAFAKLRDIT